MVKVDDRVLYTNLGSDLLISFTFFGVDFKSDFLIFIGNRWRESFHLLFNQINLVKVETDRRHTWVARRSEEVRL